MPCTSHRRNAWHWPQRQRRLLVDLLQTSVLQFQVACSLGGYASAAAHFAGKLAAEAAQAAGDSLVPSCILMQTAILLTVTMLVRVPLKCSHGGCNGSSKTWSKAMGSRYNHRSRGYGAPLRSHAFLRACYNQIRFLVNLILRHFKFSGVEFRNQRVKISIPP